MNFLLSQQIKKTIPNLSNIKKLFSSFFKKRYRKLKLRKINQR